MSALPVRMRLTKLFILTTALVLTLVSVMLARSVLQEWRVVSTAQRGLQAMEITYLAMIVAEKASFERGPTIAVLGDSDTPDAATHSRLAAARQVSDAAFVAAMHPLTGSPHTEHHAALVQLAKAREQLARARHEVDRVAALPHAQRTARGVRITRVPIDQMFLVIDTLLEAVTILSVDAERVYPELSQPLVGARLAAELREYAGRLGSQFTAPIGARTPLGAEERRDIPLLIGRIDQLRQLIEVQARANTAMPRVAAAIAEMNGRYFAIGLPFIAELTAAGTTGQNYGLDLTQFVARYVPEMASIVKLRDTMFEVARTEANAGYTMARGNLLFIAVIGILILLIEIVVFVMIRWRVLKPLLENARNVVALAKGKLDTNLPETRRSDEIGDMQRAVAVLKATSQDKQQLEIERDRLIAQLQHLSKVDFLTNLLNRRAFEEHITQQMALARRQAWPVAFIMFDLDHFKRVNDRFGHATGDTVLKKIAAIARPEFRATDTLARYGGEEFIALLINCSVADAITFAERVRTAIAQATFTAEDGTAFQITASFGVSGAMATDAIDTDALVQSADQALYRAKNAGRNRVIAD